MRITLTLDGDLVEEVSSLTETEDRSDAIRTALACYIKMKNKEKLLALRGQVDIADIPKVIGHVGKG